MAELREYVTCNLCGSTDHSHYASGRNMLWPSEVFQVVRCNVCGLVFLNPRPVDMETVLRERPFDPKVMPDPAKMKARQAFFAEWSCLVGPFAPGKRLLDFGCGAGMFWHAAYEAGWDAYGSDIGVALVRAARQYWNTDRLLAAGIEELQQRFAGFFDVINASQVFEHLTNPKRTAPELRSLLKPGGVLTIDVPSIANWKEFFRKGAILDVPAHFYYWSPATIRRLLEESGYEIAVLQAGFGGRRLIRRLVRNPELQNKLVFS